MRIAIIGAGFSGLAVATNLLRQRASFSSLSVKIFDPLGIGGGCSGIAAGLLHPFAGAHAKLNWQGLAGWHATCDLLHVASSALNAQVAQFNGVLRLAVTLEQAQDYQRCAEKHPEVEWWESARCQSFAQGLPPYSGIFIKTGAVVNSSLYLDGLWKFCSSVGALLIKETIQDLHQLHDYDKVVIATGAYGTSFVETKHLPLKPVKGQILEIRWPLHLPRLQSALNSQAYIVMNPGSSSCLVGSTYERNFTGENPDLEVAQTDLLPKVSLLFPPLKEQQVLSCRSGLRASTPTHLPLIGQIDARHWYITGMGSKGLLYHALMANQLVERMK